MSRPWQIWLIFTACLIVAVAAVGWLSMKALQADWARAEARHEAAIEENARLALWRMDSFVTPIVTQENARPWYAYHSFYGTQQASEKTISRESKANNLVPSPLLLQATRYVLLHWQWDAAKRWSSPEVPNDSLLNQAVPKFLSREQFGQRANQFADLEKALDVQQLLAQLPAAQSNTEMAKQSPNGQDLAVNQNTSTLHSQLPSRVTVLSDASVPDAPGRPPLAAYLVFVLPSIPVGFIVFIVSLLISRKWSKALSIGVGGAAFSAIVFCATAYLFTQARYESVAWLRVRDTPPWNRAAGGPTHDAEHAKEYDTYRRTQAALIRSPLVLQEALNKSGISDLPLLRAQKNPLHFLQDEIIVVTPLQSELLQIKMRGEDPQQLAKIVNAVKDSYLENVVAAEGRENVQKLNHLETVLSEIKEEIANKRAQLMELQKQTNSPDLVYPLIHTTLPTDHELQEQITDLQAQLGQLTSQQNALTVQQMPQGARNSNEYQARAKSFAQNNFSQQNGANQESVDTTKPQADRAGAEVTTSMMTPLWQNNQLLLARRVTIAESEVLQGCWLNWPALKEQMLDDIKDLLPQAELQPVNNLTADSESHRLASLPVILIPGTLPEMAPSGLSPIKQSLLIAWGALALAALAGAAVLQGVIALSERRAAFVSAVTHELRTPLTTFRMYAEMLREGMVATEEERRQYLDTLRIEADRLTHLVANVLAYARLERGRPSGRIEALSVEQLLTAATGRLADRAAQAQFQLALEPVENVSAVMVKADPAAVEQILFNLVDNACKYAVAASDRTLHLSAAAETDRVVIRLRDSGPGVSPTDQRRLFQAFRKSAQEAAHSAPGVGLGLALSQRLARDMHGELRYEPMAAGGACFALSLPIADQK